MITLAEKLIKGSKTKTAISREVDGYVEFVSSTPMTITPKYTNSGVALEYSLDCVTWTTIASSATTPSANIIYFRGSATGTKSLFTSSAKSNAWTFTGASNLEVYGKLDRLIQNALDDDEDISSIGNYCYSYMFYNNSSLIYVDDDSLPATTLANSCYSGMFYGCTSLTTLPELPAVTLANYCYFYMFYKCTSLKISTTTGGIYDTPYRIPTTGTGTTATNDTTSMFENTGGTFKGTPEINTTYYTENTPV